MFAHSHTCCIKLQQVGKEVTIKQRREAAIFLRESLIQLHAPPMSATKKGNLGGKQ